MNGAIPAFAPAGAAPWHGWTRTLMDVILHLGAHRTATTTFQHYVRDNLDVLGAGGVAFWGPQKVRKQVFPGLFRQTAAQKGRNVARRAEGRIRLLARTLQRAGVTDLLVSDENLLGTPVGNLRTGLLYPAAGERTARVSAAFGGQVRRIVLTIRAQDLWWASAAALTVARGHPVPSGDRFEAIAASRRGWRDVITDLACAAPGAEIEVMPFESLGGRPDVILRVALARTAPPDRRQHWLNRSADLQSLRRTLAEEGADPDQLPDRTGRWQPFTPDQQAMLRETYADDLHWLVAGADGLARLTEDTRLTRADSSPPLGAAYKGQTDDTGQMARPRQG